METINGEWYMKGCNPNDPQCIRNINQLNDLIQTIGFLPLFSNSIEGFSAEEHTLADSWWCDDSGRDPWIWRQILANHPDVAYGKFFGRNAGFISKAWFPIFANYRRNGYDFDALFDDELASVRSKKLMDAFELNDHAIGLELLTSELREKSGKDEKTETDLQMQTYLIMRDFRQRKNKRGQSYGWHLAVLSTPETKWGYPYVSSCYQEDPKESWNRIIARCKAHFPDADDASIQKLLGIRYPGDERNPAAHKKPKKKDTESMISSKPYPDNLLIHLGMDETLLPLNQDQEEGFDFAMESLAPRQATVIHMRFQDHMTYQAIADVYGINVDQVRQILNRAYKKLKQPERAAFYLNGYIKNQMMIQDDQNRHDQELRDRVSEIADSDEKRAYLKVPIQDLGLSSRTRNCLVGAGMNTVEDLLMAFIDDPKRIKKIRNLGSTSYAEVLRELDAIGFSMDALTDQ